MDGPSFFRSFVVNLCPLCLLQEIRKRDPANPTVGEVLLAYPGFHALVLFHPLSALLWRLKLKALARFWSYVGRFFTGIEIHPEAKIGKRVFIDHGTGLVIGQTAEVGDDCTLYHGVTLGGRGGSVDGARRHPKIGRSVIIGAGAQVLGAITVGDYARIGANAVVTSDVDIGRTVIGNPGRILDKQRDGLEMNSSDEDTYGLPHGLTLDLLTGRIEQIEAQIDSLKNSQKKKEFFISEQTKTK